LSAQEEAETDEEDLLPAQCKISWCATLPVLPCSLAKNPRRTGGLPMERFSGQDL